MKIIDSNNTETFNEDENFPLLWRYIVYITILVLALSGNMLLMTALIKIQRRKFTFTNLLLLNLAISDTLLVTSSVIFVIIRETLGSFRVGDIGCHMLYPIPTYCVNSAVMTLICLSVERFTAIKFPFSYNKLRCRSKFFIIFCHSIALICTLPYIVVSTYEETIQDCNETWSDISGAIYTLFLCMMQYVIPLPLIIAIYSLAWLMIKKQNDEIVSLAEKEKETDEISKQFSGESHTLVNQRNMGLQRNSSIKNTERNLQQQKSKVAFSSAIAINRQKQTAGILRLFIVIVIVFSIFMLPNQISWILSTVKGQRFSKKWWTVSDWLTYTNSIVNPIIYGLNKKYRQVYMSILKRFLYCCTRTFHYDMRFDIEGSMYYTLDTTFFQRLFSFRKHVISRHSTTDFNDNEQLNRSYSNANDKNIMLQTLSIHVVD